MAKTSVAVLKEKYTRDEVYAHRTFDKYASVEVIRDAPGEVHMMSGNEAVARGAIEAGVAVAASYPGSPTTYILDTISYAAREYGFWAEWSTNEKVAFEVALGAASCGKRGIMITKNVGMSWIMDPLINCVTMRLPAGLVIVIGDDAGANTTSVEMDSRLLAAAAEIPVLEPSNCQEAKDFTVEAFRLSEEQRLPVMLRISRTLCYGRGKVVLGPIDHERRQRPASFDHDPIHWTCNVSPEFLGENLAFLRHQHFHKEVVGQIQQAVEAFPGNTLKMGGGERVAVIAAGVPYAAAREAIDALGVEDQVAVLKLATVLPLPQTLVEKVLASVDKVLVVEEVEPFIETQVRDIAAGMDHHARILGKKTGDLKIAGCIDRDDVAVTLAKLLGQDYEPSFSPQRLTFFNHLKEEITHRPQGYFCPGCPEMAMAFAVKRVARKLYKDKFISHGDIGCYEHAHSEPWNLLNSVLCMGAGPGMGCGNYHSGVGEKIICNLGDSTFFHAAIPALVNAVYNKVEITFVMYDNRCTASTGHQPHPGAFGMTAMDEPTKVIKIEDVARACLVDHIEFVDPFDVPGMLAGVERALRAPGVSMVIMRRVCSVLAERQMGGRAKAKLDLYQIDSAKCEYIKKGICLVCVKELGCPSIMRIGKDLYIDPVTCFGCSVCSQVCPFDAIHKSERE